MKKKEHIGQTWQKQEDGSYTKVGGYKVDTPDDYIFPWYLKAIGMMIIISLIVFGYTVVKFW